MADKGKHEKPMPPGSRPLPLRDKPVNPGKHEGRDKDQGKGGKGRPPAGDVIRVQGIDRDSEPWRELFAGRPPRDLARELYLDGWKYARLDRDGTPVGGVQFDAAAGARSWWGEAG